MAYCTTADVKAELGISGNGQDTLIAAAIEEAQDYLEESIQCKFEASSDTTRNFDVSEDVEGLELLFDYPIASITTITNGDGNEVTSSEYVTRPRNTTPYWSVKILSSANKKWEYDSTTLDPEDAIEVVGKWAYSETAPKAIKKACKRLAQYYFKLKDSQVFDVTAIPNAGVITVPKGIPADVQKTIDIFRQRVRLK